MAQQKAKQKKTVVSSVYSWNCSCGRLLFRINITREAGARYIFCGACPECGRKLRRCFNLAKEDYDLAKSLVRQTTSKSVIRSRKVHQYTFPQEDAKQYAVRLTKMAADTEQLDNKPLLDAIASHCGVQQRTILMTVRGLNLKEFHMLDAPPFMREARRMRFALYEFVPTGGIVPACPFCLLRTCNRQGVMCKAVMEGEFSLRFLQIGEDH